MPEQAREGQKPSFFLISVSTRKNLELCIKYALAGFPSGQGGAWTFCEIREGDLISFLYGARAHNLYRVKTKVAVRDAQAIPPSWEPLKSRKPGKTYFFPYRLQLEQLRSFDESLVRAEFAYVAENLLLRGGYRKTHFQADQTTLQSVSQIGAPAEPRNDNLDVGPYPSFNPRFARKKELYNPPEVMPLTETVLQSAIRRLLVSQTNLASFLNRLNFNEVPASEFEILGEKALPQGHIDILLKKRVPLGADPKIPVEVKTKKALPKDLAQLRSYMDELRGECPIGILIASGFHKNVIASVKHSNVKLVHYSLGTKSEEPSTFDELWMGLVLEVVDA
jgi:hypothetical protein